MRRVVKNINLYSLTADDRVLTRIQSKEQPPDNKL